MDDENWFKWSEDARQKQNQMCNVLGNRLYDEIDSSNLTNKVRFALFGSKSGYNEEESKLIDKLNDKIISLSGDIVYLNFVYVLIKLKSNQNEHIEVLIRLGVKEDGILQPPIYLDSALRVYKGWKHYLETNKLPKCYMCYPVNGVYEKDEEDIVKLHFGESHACDRVSSFLNVTDFLSTAGGLVGMGVLSASLFTPIGFPVVIGALTTSAVSGVYDVGRNVAKLTDMHIHDESIGLDSSKARMAWFGVLASAAGVASVGSSAALKTAQKIGLEGAVDLMKMMKILNISSLCMNGLSVTNGIISIVLKCYNGNLNKKDVFAFVLSCAFMFNAIISMVMARRMINEISQKHISSLGNVIPMLSCTINPAVHVVDQYDNYKRLLSLIVGLPALFTDSIDLHKIECSILNIRDKTISVAKGDINLTTFVSTISVDVLELWNCYKKVSDKISDVTYDIAFNPTFYLKNESSQMVPRPLNIAIMHDLGSKVRSTADKLSINQSEEVTTTREKIIMRLASEFDSLQPAENLSEFLFKVTFFCQHLEDKFQGLKLKYENKLDVAKKAKGFDKSTFNFKNGIRGGNLNSHFFKETVKPSTKEFKYLYQIYNSQKQKSFNDTYFQNFEYESVFAFCVPPCVSNFTKNEYFSYASTFSGVNIDETTSEIFTDDCLVVLDPLPQHPVPRVLFYNPNNNEETCLLGIAVVEKNIKTKDKLTSLMTK